MSKRNVAVETDDDLICPYVLAKPINSLTCEFIFSKALNEHLYRERYHDPDHLGLDMRSKKEKELEFESMREEPPSLELRTAEYVGKIENEFIVERLIA